MRKNFDNHSGERESGTAFDRFLKQQRRSGRRWASGGKYDPRHRENWDDVDDDEYDYDEYEDYDDYDEEEFDSYSS